MSNQRHKLFFSSTRASAKQSLTETAIAEVAPVAPNSKSYPSFAQIPAGQNPANWVLINGRYYFNDYDTTGNYLRAQFAR